MNRRLFLGAAAASVAVLPDFANAAEPAAGSVKLIGLVGSLRKGKSTYKAMQLAMDSAKTVSPAIATDIIELSGLNRREEVIHATENPGIAVDAEVCIKEIRFGQEPFVVLRVGNPGEVQLLEVVEAVDSMRFAFCFCQGGQEKAGQNSDDRNDHQ